ncbi:MAG: class IV adenylate cyclase [Clostridia bacterium]
MNIEYEVRVLEINSDELINRLERIGAKFIGKYDQKRYVYNTIPKKEGKWLRLRTNGEETTLTYKSVEKNSIDGTKELEIKVEDFEKTNELLELVGIKSKGYQENRRIRYLLDDVEVDIDTWPLIPTYVEIEGKDEDSVNNVIKKLELQNNKVTALDVQSVYEKIYNIDISKISTLKF